LTRCVYNLRKILLKTKDIETLYGKGYRFVGQVSRGHVSEPIGGHHENTIRTAIFPYQMANKLYSIELNDQIIDIIHLHFSNECENYVLASLAFNQMANKYHEMLNMVQVGEIDFYITGSEINYKGEKKVRLELTCGANHGVIKRVVLPLHQRLDDDLICHSNEIVNMLSFIDNGNDNFPRGSASLPSVR
ncbi:hypothetical protein, partial [Serratia silvae]